MASRPSQPYTRQSEDSTRSRVLRPPPSRVLRLQRVVEFVVVRAGRVRVRVRVCACGALAVVVLLRSSLYTDARSLYPHRVLRETAACGFKGLGNKGAVAMRLQVRGATLCFVVVHLPAGSSSDAARSRETALHECVASLGLKLQRAGVMAPLAHDLCVVLGDFNSRVHLSREVAETAIAKASRRGRVSGCDPLDELFSSDELRRRGVAPFNEAAIAFPPTYKFDVGTSTYDTSAKRRVPSWTDRVLYKGPPPTPVPVPVPPHQCGLATGRECALAQRPIACAHSCACACGAGGDVSVLRYTSVDGVCASDHKPVVAVLEWPLPADERSQPDQAHPNQAHLVEAEGSVEEHHRGGGTLSGASARPDSDSDEDEGVRSADDEQHSPTAPAALVGAVRPAPRPKLSLPPPGLPPALQEEPSQLLPRPLGNAATTAPVEATGGADGSADIGGKASRGWGLRRRK